MSTLVDARSFAPEVREDSWRSRVHGLFALDGRRGDELPTGFYTRLLRHDFGSMHLSEIEGHAHCSHISPPKPAPARHDTVIAWIALQGSGWLLQDGRRVPIAPGVVSICDGAKPRGIT